MPTITCRRVDRYRISNALMLAARPQVLPGLEPTWPLATLQLVGVEVRPGRPRVAFAGACTLRLGTCWQAAIGA
jgi:hypothetical protein